jgi:feruloyl-CoA synthase
LRARFIDHFAPYVRDVVLAGADRNEIGALVFPDIVACRKLAPDLSADAPAEAVLKDERVREAFAGRLKALAQDSPGSSTRVARALLMAEPPLLDRGEMTDKGSINQRAVLGNRAALVDRLYGTARSPHVIDIKE